MRDLLLDDLQEAIASALKLLNHWIKRLPLGTTLVFMKLSCPALK